MNDPLRHRSGRLWPAYLATFSFMLGQWSAGVVVPLLVVALGGSLSEAGLVAAIRFGLGALFSLPFGAMADAWGTRRALLVALAGNALVNLVPILAVASGSLAPVYGWAVLGGLTSSLFLPANSAYVAGTAAPDARGSAFGWLTLATHTGVASGPVVGGLLWQEAGPAAAFAASSALGMVALVAPAFMSGSVRTEVNRHRLPAMIRGVARDRVIVGCWVGALGIGLPWGAVTGLFPLFGTSLGIAAGSVGLLLGLQSVVNGLSRVPLGRLIDRGSVPPRVAAVTCVGYGTATASLGLQDGPPGIAGVFLVGILALAATLMLVQVVISERAPVPLRATGLGGYSTFLAAGQGIGPLVAGATADAGGFGIGFASVGLLGCLAAVASGVLIGRAPRLTLPR